MLSRMSHPREKEPLPAGPAADLFRERMRGAPAFERDQALVEAAGAGALWKLRILHEELGDSLQDFAGEALWRAAKEGHLDVVRYLVEGGCDVNTYFSNGFSFATESYPFHMAVDRGHWEVAVYMAEKGANVGANHAEALLLAAGKPDILGRLLKAGGDRIGKDALEQGLLFAVALKNPDSVALYLEKPERVTPAVMTRASDAFDSRIMKLLLAVCPSAAVEEGAFKEAMRRDRFEVLRAFLESGHPRNNAAIGEALEETTHFNGSKTLLLLKDWQKPQSSAEKTEMQRYYRARLSLRVFPPPSPEDFAVKDAQGRTFAAQLALAGEFDRMLRPAFAGLSPETLCARDANGINVAVALDKYGELSKLFDPDLWKGREDDLAKVWDDLPAHMREGVDMISLSAKLTRIRLQKNRPKKTF